MKRRIFIKAGTGAFLASFIPYRLFTAGNIVSRVIEITGESEASVKMLFTSLGGIKKLIGIEPASATVLVKPNLCLPHNDSNGTITSVGMVKAVCNYLIGEGIGRVIIADHTLQTADKFEKTEIVNYARNTPAISLILANEQRYYVPRQLEGKVLKSAETLKVLDKVNYFINLATAKHHNATQVSLCIKNLMGTIWNRQVFHTEIDLDQAIADLTLAICPHLNIIDASRVLINRGPVGPGPMENPGKLYASTDILAVDAVVTSAYNFGGRSVAPKEVAHLWESYKNGAGEIDLKKIEVVKLTA